MAGITREQFKGMVSALYSAKDSTAVGNVYDEFLRAKVRGLVTDGGTAATAVTETPLGEVPEGGKVIGVKFTTPVAVTASDSVYATITVAKRTGSGGATTIATFTTKTSGSGGSGNLTAFVPFSLTLTDANVLLAAGDELTVAIAKASTGTALAAATSWACVEVLYEKGV